MSRLFLAPFFSWARKLTYPTLFKFTAIAFAISILWPFDPIPFIDEIVLGLGTLLLANWKDRNKPADAPASGDGNPPIDSSAKRG